MSTEEQRLPTMVSDALVHLSFHIAALTIST